MAYSTVNFPVFITTSIVAAATKWQRHPRDSQLWTNAKSMIGVYKKLIYYTKAGKFTYTQVKYNTKQKGLFLFLVM